MDELDRPSGWVWPNHGEELPGPMTRGVRRLGLRLPQLIWPIAFMFYLVQPVAEVWSQPAPAWLRIGVTAVIGSYSISYIAVMARFMCATHRLRVVLTLWLFLHPVLLALMVGPKALVFWTYAVATGLVLLPRNYGVALGLGSAITTLLATWAVNGTPEWDNAMILVVMSMAMYGFTALHQTIDELRATRHRLADLAVEEERSRLARDLHDVLGHSLTTITVKAGLARRVLESGGEMSAAVAEVHDVEQLSRQALTEVRATVSGYRKASLPAELAGARAALRAAEIRADLPHAVDNVPAELQEPFAYVLREGITNVVRHSRATKCQVRLSATSIEVSDDGRGSLSTVDGPLAGNGLAGLSERLAKVGGTISACPGEDGGFRLVATVSDVTEPVKELT